MMVWCSNPSLSLRKSPKIGFMLGCWKEVCMGRCFGFHPVPSHFWDGSRNRRHFCSKLFHPLKFHRNPSHSIVFPLNLDESSFHSIPWLMNPTKCRPIRSISAKSVPFPSIPMPCRPLVLSVTTVFEHVVRVYSIQIWREIIFKNFMWGILADAVVVVLNFVSPLPATSLLICFRSRYRNSTTIWRVPK